MIAWNITCACGMDTDFGTIREARREAKKHLEHDKTDFLCTGQYRVFIDQVNTEGDEEGNYQTGKTVIVRG